MCGGFDELVAVQIRAIEGNDEADQSLAFAIESERFQRFIFSVGSF